MFQTYLASIEDAVSEYLHTCAESFDGHDALDESEQTLDLH